jgi:hypothetical protein
MISFRDFTQIASRDYEIGDLGLPDGGATLHVEKYRIAGGVVSLILFYILCLVSLWGL